MDERRNLFHLADLSEEVLKGFFANVLIHLVSMEGVEPTRGPAYETSVLPLNYIDLLNYSSVLVPPAGVEPASSNYGYQFRRLDRYGGVWWS